MRLKDYLHNFDITVEDFADKADIPYTTMNKYVHGQRVPSKNYMKKINEITKGAVSANDFYNTISSEDWEWKVTYERDFSKAYDGAQKILGGMDIHPLAFSVVVEMVAQMGFDGVSQFKNFLAALKDANYTKAADEMKNSRWGKQTPKIANTLSEKLMLAKEKDKEK
ncbi:MAG: glycoside hydrolase family protein [Pseudomonadota bacterium]|nr:glycoside hydrolase family protein [Pseudomonadota bacterium]|tara:strand:+ start:7140 stop:7640 length:501 start_codon:yes stop_codon:yes gene_type:complete